MVEKTGKYKVVNLMIFSAWFYGLCSGSMNIINKLLLNTWSFQFPEVLMSGQLLFVIVSIKALKTFKKVELVDYDAQSAKSCFLLSFFYSSNTFVALFALSGMNLPMYIALRRCVPMASAILSYIVLSKRLSRLIQASISIISAGAIIAAFGDTDFNLRSYTLGSMSTILMASYLVTLQYTGMKDKMTSLSLLYVNSCNCFPFIFLLSLRYYQEVMIYPHLSNPRFIFCFLLVVASGALLNYSLFLCTTINSALTTTYVGVIKSVFVTIIGMFLFGGTTLTPFLIVGLSINFLGSLMYAYAKFYESKPASIDEVKV